MYIYRKKDISFSEWESLVVAHPNLLEVHVFEKLDFKYFDDAILRVDGLNYGSLNAPFEPNYIEIDTYDKYLPVIYEALVSIAEALSGVLYYKKGVIFDPKKHLPTPAVEISRHELFCGGDGLMNLDNIRWLALRETDQELVLSHFGLKIQRKGKLVELFPHSKIPVFILTPAYKGWRFLLGDGIIDFMIKGSELSTNEALVNVTKYLRKLSKKFNDVQYYEFQDASSVNGYFKAKNGKFIYGYWESDIEKFVKGKRPKELSKNCSAHDVASIWSIDPQDFVFIKDICKKDSYLLEK